jgi:hypothetical protein
MTKSPQQILAEYRDKAERLRAIHSQHKELQPLSIPDVLSIKMALHPTNRRESKDLTRRLVEYLVEVGICTADDIYQSLGCADKPVLQRLRKFKEYGLVRRESKKYYIATGRMDELHEKFIEKVCE